MSDLLEMLVEFLFVLLVAFVLISVFSDDGGASSITELLTGFWDFILEGVSQIGEAWRSGLSQ